jgi:hypothetical protein
MDLQISFDGRQEGKPYGNFLYSKISKIPERKRKPRRSNDRDGITLRFCHR